LNISELLDFLNSIPKTKKMGEIGKLKEELFIVGKLLARRFGNSMATFNPICLVPPILQPQRMLIE